MKNIVGIILLISCPTIISQECLIHTSPRKASITKDVVCQYRDKGFDAFIATKKKEYNILSTVTSIPLIGSVASWGLQHIGGVNTDEAKLFLGRIFEAEQEFLTHVQKLEQDPHNLTYLQAIFDQAPRNLAQTKSKEELVRAMRKARHPRVPTPKKMGEKIGDNQYTITNSDFLPFAACNLWAMHWLEKQEQVPKKHRKKKAPTTPQEKL